MSSDQNAATESEQQVNNDLSMIDPGSLLKAKRESLGLTQEQIAERLRLKVTTVKNIENNQFEDGQVATFTRGYLRSYAKAVQLDEKQLFDALDARGEAQHAEQDMQSFSLKTKQKKHDSRITKITWGIGFVLIGISTMWWWQAQEQENRIESDPAPLVSESPLPTTREETPSSIIEANNENNVVDNTAALDSSAMSPDFTESETATPDVVVEVNESQPLVTENELPEATDDSNIEMVNGTPSNDITSDRAVETQEGGVEIVSVEPTPISLSFSADCWIQVSDAAGKILSTGIKKAGQTLDLIGAKPFKVILGAPEAVSITFASEPVDLSGYTSGKVARFTLP